MTLTNKLIKKTVSTNSADQVHDQYLETKILAGSGLEINQVSDGSDGYALQIVVSTPFTATLNTAETTLLETGATVTDPAFTVSYSKAASSATLTDTDGYETVLTTPFTSVTSAHTYTHTAAQTVVFTLSAARTAGGQSATSTKTFTWGSKVFYGVAVPATYDEAFIEGLASSSIQNSRAKSFTATAGATEYIYYACKTSYGDPTFTVGGFDGGFQKVASSVSLTNSFSVTEAYDLWRSDNLNLGSTTVGVN